MTPDHTHHPVHSPTAHRDPQPGGGATPMPMQDDTRAPPGARMEHSQPPWPHFANMMLGPNNLRTRSRREVSLEVKKGAGLRVCGVFCSAAALGTLAEGITESGRRDERST